jgi:hypothetical protein
MLGTRQLIQWLHKYPPEGAWLQDMSCTYQARHAADTLEEPSRRRRFLMMIGCCCTVQEYTAKLGALQAKGDDYEIAAAQIGVEVYSAMSAAVGA